MYPLVNWAFDKINAISPVVVQTPNHRAFGNCAEEMVYGHLKAQRDGKKVLFLYPRPLLFGRFGLRVPANREMFRFRSDNSVSNENLPGFLGGCLLSGYLLTLRGLNTLRRSRMLRRIVRLPSQSKSDRGYGVSTIGRAALWLPEGIHVFSRQRVEDQSWLDQYQNYSAPRLREDKRRYSEELRIQMGIPLSDWYVCLHVSEYNVPTARASSIHNYIDAIKVITDAGGWVVRLGDSSMVKLEPMEGVIDYPHTRYKSRLMDLYLLSHCHC